MATSLCNKILVAAIDFGTTYSGYAFSLRHEHEIDKMRIHTNNSWAAGHKNLYSHKTPTCILFSPKKEFKSFGYEAEDTFSELALDEKHADWYFFRRFKMKLYNNMKLNRGMVIQDDFGKTMNAKKVFGMGIMYLKNHLLDHLRSRNIVQALDEKTDIQWVLTVPAIWDDRAKQFMREAAREAGIADDQLLIALEPEAASMYCKELPFEKFHNDGPSAEMIAFRPGTKYMVLDLGGGTVDVTVQKVLPNNDLRELYKASGNASGGTCVDAAFNQMLISVVGTRVMKKFKTEFASDDVELLREFETKKRLVTATKQGEITLRIPISLLECFEEETKEKLVDVIKQSNKRGMTWARDQLKVDCNIIKSLFDTSINSIIDHVSDLLKLESCQDLQYILMVGGFSECALVQDAIKKKFSNHCVIIPHESGLAVLMGAVLFGYNPKTIVSRVAKYTYGVRIYMDFRNGIDPQEKRLMVNGKAKCKNRFSKHVEVGETIELDKELDPRTYKPLTDDCTNITMHVFTSTEKDPQYTTDVSCTELGKFVVPLGSNSKSTRNVDVCMTFGDTELHVKAEDKSSGKVYDSYFDFLDQCITES